MLKYDVRSRSARGGNVVSSDVFWSALPGMSLLERAGRMRAGQPP
jgi:hypothetical protein